MRSPRPGGPRACRVALVRSPGAVSLDRYSQQLAAAIGERPGIEIVEASETLAERWGTVRDPGAGARRWRAEASFLAMLRRVGEAVHFPNHHFARYGPRLHLPYLVTVHDLIRHADLKRQTPMIHSLSRRERHLLARDRAGILDAAGLIAVSEHAAWELQTMLGGAERIAVVHEGIDHESYQPQAGRRPLSDPYLLYVGSEQPRKNLASLLEAFAELKSEPRFRSLRLVKVGSPGRPEAPFREETLRAIRRLGLDREVLFTGRISDEELACWYSHAACLALPSLAEGFGLPPLEAMACRCPVIVSDRGSLPEIAGPGALVADGADAQAIHAACRSVLEDPQLRESLRERGQAHAASLTWERAAAETLDAYARFLPEQSAAARRTRLRARIASSSEGATAEA